MKAKATRPVFINLWRIKFPIPAIISILHRVSGVIIFLAMPILLYFLSQSLISQESFDHLASILIHPAVKIICWLIVAAVIYHTLAGIRHLFMDAGIGESLEAARTSAYLVIIISAVLILLAGVWLWY